MRHYTHTPGKKEKQEVEITCRDFGNFVEGDDVCLRCEEETPGQFALCRADQIRREEQKRKFTAEDAEERGGNAEKKSGRCPEFGNYLETRKQCQTCFRADKMACKEETARRAAEERQAVLARQEAARLERERYLDSLPMRERKYELKDEAAKAAFGKGLAECDVGERMRLPPVCVDGWPGRWGYCEVCDEVRKAACRKEFPENSPQRTLRNAEKNREDGVI
jgi:hypothetical protein